MIAWCRHAGMDPTGYTSREHPVQERIVGLVARLAGEQRAGLGLGVDGCRVPTVGLKLASIARLFLLLGVPSLLSAGEQKDSDEDPSSLEAGLDRVAGAMARHPLMVAGEGRVDTDVIQATRGRWVTKAGAEGLWCGVDRERRVGFAFKAIDGASRAVVPAALAVLHKAGVLSPDEFQGLSRHADPVVRDRSGDKVGRVKVRLPE